MKNLVLNLRNAKAQAGCAKSKHTSLSFRKGLGGGLTCLLLTLGVGQMNAADASSANIYYDNTLSAWSDVQIFIGHSTWSVADGMTKLTNSNNLYYKRSYSWGGYSAFYFTTGASGWDGRAENVDTRVTYTTHYSAKKTDNLSNSTWLFISTGGSNGSSVSGSTITGYDKLNYTQTVQQTLSTDGGSTYSTSTASLATVKVASYYLSSASATSATATSGTISAGNSSANCKAVRTATVTYTVSSVTDGYSFVGWYDGSTQKSTSTTYTYNATEAKTITARFKAEETHDVTVYYKYGSTTVKTSTTETAVGVTTERTFTAPDIDGFNFYSYTFGSGLTMKSDNTTTNPCRFVTKGSGTYSLTVNYNIAPVKMYYGSTSTFTNSSYSAMTYDATAKAYYVDVTTNSSPYYFRFEFNNGVQEYSGNWNSFPDVNAVTANGSKVACSTEVKGWTDKASLKYIGESGMAIRVWFSYKDKQSWIEADKNKQYVLRGANADDASALDGMPGWAATTSFFDGLASGSTGTVSCTLNAAEWYHLKVYDMYNKTWYGTTGSETELVDGVYGTMGSGNDFYFGTTIAGSYTFTLDLSSGTKIKVDYPVSYQLNYSIGTVAGTSGSISTSPSTSSGSYVASGSTITLTAPDAKTGYTWKGWYLAADGSGTQQCATQAYDVTMNADKTLYACYTENSYNVTVSNDGHGTVSPTGTVAVKQISGTALTATPSTNYVFKDWTISGGGITPTTSSSNPQTFKATTTGGTIRANFADQWNVKGDQWDNWGTYNGMPYAGVANTFSKTFTLPAKTTYHFKVVKRAAPGGSDVWYGVNNGKTLTRASNSVTGLEANGGETEYITFTTDAAGDYTITYLYNANVGSMKVTVTYPTAYTVTFGKGTGGNTITASATSAGGSFTSGSYVASGDVVTFSQTALDGYTFKGWYTTADGSTSAGVDGSGHLTINAAKTVYAQYTPNNYTVSLDVDEPHKGNIAGATTNHTVTYKTVTTAVPNLPTAADAYGLDGYYTGQNGAGTKLINGDGTFIASVDGYTDADNKWIRVGGVTLYAYYKKAEITEITLDADMKEPMPSADPDESKNYVIANPTIEPSPEGTNIVCWEFLYDNDNPLPAGHESSAYTEGGTKPNQVRFSIVGLAAGTYKIRATLRTGSSCAGGTEISTLDKKFVISNAYTVTILYQDEADHTNIAASTTSPGKATECISISAPDIFGYTFNGWQLGDGITSEDPTSKQTDFCFKATFDGTIIAEYTKKEYIYLDLSQEFSSSGKWSTPYVYFYNEDPWVNGKGAGATGHTHYISGSGHAMTQIEGTDIWYFDYSGVDGAGNYIAFTKTNQTTYEHFYATDVIFRGDFSEGTPLFVPATDQTKETVNSSSYYNKGYWVKYLGPQTGYTMLVYNSAGDVVLKRERFESAEKRVPMHVSIDIDPGTYQIEVYRNDGHWYKQHAGSTFNSSNQGPIALDGSSKGNLVANASGTYIFTLGYSSGNLQLSVAYPATVGDFRLCYTDNATWSQAHTINTWKRPSHPIIHRANGVDTVSFFISKGDGITAKIRWEKATAVSSSNVTWGTTGSWTTTGLTDVETAGVYNFKVTQNENGTAISSIERIGEYEGGYYIRCNALNSKWDHYTTDGDHRMTYSSFSESAANSFGEKYSHYKTKWCPRNTNIKFCIANDYSPCITDTLTQDLDIEFNNTESDGTLKYEKDGSGNMKYDDASAYLDKYSANVRFMWNRSTNKICRRYVAAATSNEARFLVLQGSGTANSNIYNGSTGAAFTANPPGANSVILQDDQNWIYEVIIQANPSALAKLYANYNGVTQWFRGAEGTPFVNGVNAIELLGGDPVSSKYSVRVIYDFKTNRLVCAWMPTGASQEIGSDLDVDADVMVIREHQEPAQCITFANDAKMTDVKTVYGAMKFNRWILGNRAHPEDVDPTHCRESDLGNDLQKYHPVLPVGEQKSIYERSLYFISFPFDVRVSEIFGFGRYWDEWYLEYYDGLTRAKNGYWMDSPPNWKYIDEEMAKDYVLKANEGYILGLDLDFMQADNVKFWSNGISTVELYFPSTVDIETLQSTNCTIPALNEIAGDPYRCTINRGTTEGDRRVKDSYWRCIGVPSFNIYNSALKDSKGNSITWHTSYTWQEDDSEFPFIYMWNKGDNTLTAQSTSNFRFDPMHAYLAQIGSKIIWTAVSAQPSSIVARQAAEETPTEYNWRITLEQNDEMIDQTYVRMTNIEQVTDTFDFGQDLAKELNYGRSDIYTLIGYERAAANSKPIETKNTTIIPLGLNIEKSGDYTFAIPEGTNGVGVTLVDEGTGIRTSLGALTYTVSLEKGDYNERFYLEISPIHSTPTGVGNVPGDDAQNTKVRKVIIDQNMYIIRDGKMYDARGARVE